MKAAESVWNLRHIRSAILSYLPDDGLAKTIILDKENFVESVKILYETVTPRSFSVLDEKGENLASKCFKLLGMIFCPAINSKSLRTHPVIFSDHRLGLDSTLMPDGHGETLEIIYQPDIFAVTGKTQAVLWEDYDDTFLVYGGDYLRDISETDYAEVNEKWDVQRKIKHAFADGQREQDDIDGEIYDFFESWLDEEGLFANEVNSLDLQVHMRTETIIKEFRKLSENNSPMPKKLQLVVNEDSSDIEYSLIAAIETLSPLIEDLHLGRDSILEDDETVIRTTVRQFLTQPIRWPPGNLKLKTLRFPLMIITETDSGKSNPQQLDTLAGLMDEQSPHLGLRSLTIDLDFAFQDQSLDDVKTHMPRLSNLARKLIRIGGTGCTYSLNVRVLKEGNKKGNEELLSGLLTEAVREEMVKIWGEEPTCWRRLSSAERI
ncbi:uncharacterized protein I206_106821 [Kwoniella pini CBS 10737]|uniref:Uncharacterized protein n=1 Tax=Kwoniella pini CBS 10737 TaxID=1296096 RepID=A0A1B9HZZ0_9TREE|nr:uncharacterized protein I206_05634 [Kwoniella pini CBS 10737]OCF48853.1 hypothetical protein I206_05634 [Kwoniella pini CBS 10737]